MVAVKPPTGACSACGHISYTRTHLSGTRHSLLCPSWYRLFIYTPTSAYKCGIFRRLDDPMAIPLQYISQMATRTHPELQVQSTAPPHRGPHRTTNRTRRTRRSDATGLKRLTTVQPIRLRPVSTSTPGRNSRSFPDTIAPLGSKVHKTPVCPTVLAMATGTLVGKVNRQLAPEHLPKPAFLTLPSKFPSKSHLHDHRQGFPPKSRVTPPPSPMRIASQDYFHCAGHPACHRPYHYNLSNRHYCLWNQPRTLLLGSPSHITATRMASDHVSIARIESYRYASRAVRHRARLSVSLRIQDHTLMQYA
jgi:hypothetical protein